MRLIQDKQAQTSFNKLLAALNRELVNLDADLDDYIRKSPLWRVSESLLTSVPDVGAKSAHILLAERPELGTLNRRQIASLAGLAPWTIQSGKWCGRSFIGGGRGNVRSVLFMAALVASRYNPYSRTFEIGWLLAACRRSSPS